MPGQRNQLAPPEIDDRVWSDTRGSSGQLYPPNADTPGYTFGSFGQLPTATPPQTYTGALPTPPTGYAQHSADLPAEYYHLLAQQPPGMRDNPMVNQLLQMIYLRRKERT